MAKPKIVGDVASQHVRSIPNATTTTKSVVVVRNSYATLKLGLVIAALTVILAYICFTVASMVPQARSHFFDVLMNPSLSYFLAY